jgi:riboflavin synthase
MFSGIVEGLGEVVSLSKAGKLLVSPAGSFKASSTTLGESLAVNGVCLTVVEHGKSQENRKSKSQGEIIAFDVIPETLRKTTLGALKKGDKVNLERSLKLGERISGHLVTGHVDGCARLIRKIPDGKESLRMVFSYPKEFRIFLATKGSIALSGISLTLGEVTQDNFSVYLTQHTLKVTTLAQIAIGEKANFEVDLLARYVVASQA